MIPTIHKSPDVHRVDPYQHSNLPQVSLTFERKSFDTGISTRFSAQEQLSIAVMGLTGERVRDEYPVGSAAAKIGIVLSSCMLRVEATERDEAHVPWGIRESGFDETACLLWFADPQERSLTKKIQNAGCHGEVAQALRTLG